jgi:hypothetical protein
MRACGAVASIVFCLGAAAQEPVVRFGTTVVIPDGLRGQIYYLKRDTQQLPNFRKLKPVGTIYTTTLNVPPQRFDDGFPGVGRRFEWFAIDYTGKFWVQYPGIYRFLLTSDDGAKLYIDGKLIVDNDGTHAPLDAYGEAVLKVGLHRIEVAYFQGPRFSVALILRGASPDEPMKVFDVDEFKPPPGTEVPVEAEEQAKKKR